VRLKSVAHTAKVVGKQLCIVESGEHLGDEGVILEASIEPFTKANLQWRSRLDVGRDGASLISNKSHKARGMNLAHFRQAERRRQVGAEQHFRQETHVSRLAATRYSMGKTGKAMLDVDI
jgi:hypothetical protein